MDETRERSVGRLVWGLFLAVLGGALLAANLGWIEGQRIWSYWPFLLIALGTVKLLFQRGEGCGNGLWLILAGVYGWISIWNVWGLSWGTAWPIFIIAAGLEILAKPFMRPRRKQGDSHVA